MIISLTGLFHGQSFSFGSTVMVTSEFWSNPNVTGMSLYIDWRTPSEEVPCGKSNV